MEQVRILIAIVLSFLVFFLWEMFFVKREPVKQAPPGVETAQQAETPPAERVDTAPYVPEPTAPPTTAESVSSESAERLPGTVQVETPRFRVRLSEAGGTIKSVQLKNYREEVEPDSPLKELIDAAVRRNSLTTGMLENSLPGMADAVYARTDDRDAVTVEDGSETVTFRWRSPTGVVVEKQYRFVPDSYLIGFTVSIKNGSDAMLSDNLTVAMRKALGGDRRVIGFEGASARVDQRVRQVKVKKPEDSELLSGELSWMALQGRYFLQALIPDQPVGAGVRIQKESDTVIQSRLIHPPAEIAPGMQQTFGFSLFYGPKSWRELKETGYELAAVIDFGWFDFIAKPCLWVMNFLYGFIPNYGIAIVILTLMTKILLWPLGTKSYKSMSEMKKIQPLMNEIREKYKGDKKQMNQEMMALYRTYKINPMGGCLPMAAQIPVFIALYRMLYEAIELRHAPFFGWINDLSAPDRLFRFGFNVPFMEPPYGVPVLTLIMGASMLIQQKMTPTPGDPSQAKMMMLMPVVFTVIFINFPSGLVLYWLVNQIVSIAQQQFIQRKYA